MPNQEDKYLPNQEDKSLYLIKKIISIQLSRLIYMSNQGDKYLPNQEDKSKSNFEDKFLHKIKKINPYI